ncbi:MAG: ATP-binding cassette domain-containing protein [Bacillota bacterium]
MDIFIRLNDLSFQYSNSTEYALKGINFLLKQGEFIVVTGPSGAGKTTLTYCLNGVIPHFQRGSMCGQIFLGEHQTKDLSTARIATRVGSVFQDPEAQLICAKVEEEIAYGPENLGVSPKEIASRIDEALKLIGIEELRERSTKALSGGQKQRVAIAAALAMKPSCLVLDEPTSELDPVGTTQILELLGKLNREQKITVVLVEQKLEEVMEYATRLVIMDKGQIALDGPPAEVFDKANTLTGIGVKLPQIVSLFSKLGMKGKIPLSLPEADDMIKEFIRGETYGRYDFRTG